MLLIAECYKNKIYSETFNSFKAEISQFYDVCFPNHCYTDEMVLKDYTIKSSST